MRLLYKLQKPDCPTSVFSGAAVVKFSFQGGKADCSSPGDGIL